ncbi:M1 family metallopeptidase [Yeosuana sp. MJ-SS3]|jgi:hypothetical protein|uniref:M1 family metallopeptidase n=1 Tax=Gilvirhabdus luticola TaxID=3079858 RepID=A0ABU3U4I8_9FLAO|nr:M1 family metallopeptidase [Yeosuana sp. MJ-SS3]MDU8885276.1 M1 family metallopeptidase [Yeosuana sp. MJ-SS3]
MKNFIKSLLIFFLIASYGYSQNQPSVGHTDQNKFRQMKDLLPTPNNQHTASGAPGYEYTQQKVDYVMNIRLDENSNRIYGQEEITYKNNSKHHLEYLWLQLDQNKRAANSKTPDITSEVFDTPMNDPMFFTNNNIKKPFDGGFNIEYVKNADGNPLSYSINQTMMRINLVKPIPPGDSFEFNIKWWYNINNHVEDDGRSGYETFDDGNNSYAIAQFFPRLAVYNNVEGWQNMQFWGTSEFALEFGDYDVKITVPKDHIVEATGKLQNEKEVLSNEQRKRIELAKKSFTDPVFIVTEEEARANEMTTAIETQTWHYRAKNVRDFAFASSRKFIWEQMAVNINGKTVMAVSLYPKEGNPLWEEHSTRVVANTLELYSSFTFDYPYHKAVSVHAAGMGMEYPMICFNWGRPRPDGTYSEYTKNSMINVITHEIGHNFFPMIVNSDERQWAWMDEGINSFLETLAELDYDPNFDTGNLPKDIVRYMAGDQKFISPIMSQGDYVHQLSPNAYTKPAAALYMLRHTIMGPELFDYAFKTYAKRWMFKHPTPADFFRTMEDASAMDLDWFWRGWFYTTDVCDIGVKDVKRFYLTNKPTKKAEEFSKNYNLNLDQYKDYLIFYTEMNDSINKEDIKKASDFEILTYYLETLPEEEKKQLGVIPNYFYQVTFEKPGGLVMPIIAKITYEDGTTETKKYPAQIWRYNENEVSKVIKSDKAIVKITIDPSQETADVDTSNNSWPREIKQSKFEQFKSND